MAEALKTFREGEDILASETNENNQYLLSKLSDNAAQVQSYVEGEIATIKSNVASVQATLQNNIDSVNEIARNLSKIAPDYAKCEARDRDVVYTADTIGWVFFYSLSVNANKVTYEISGQVYNLCANTNRDTDTAGAGVWFMVSEGDTYKLNSKGASSDWQAYFYPCKGLKEAE